MDFNIDICLWAWTTVTLELSIPVTWYNVKLCYFHTNSLRAHVAEDFTHGKFLQYRDIYEYSYLPRKHVLLNLID